MPQNAYLLAKIGADKAENERNFAKNLPMRVGEAAAGIRRCTGSPFHQRMPPGAVILDGVPPRAGKSLDSQKCFGDPPRHIRQHLRIIGYVW